MGNTGSDLETMLGDPRKAMRSIVGAFFLALAIVQINQFVDTFWVSGLGVEAGSAVSTVIPIYGLMMCAGLGLGTGATTCIAYHLGRGETGYVSRLAGNSLILAVLFAFAGSVLAAIFAVPVIELMGAGDLTELCIDYLVPYILLSPFLLCETVVGSMLRGEGAARKATVVQSSAAIFNMIIDPVLIYGLDMGLAGAGLATCVAAILSMMIGLYWYRAGKTVVRLDRSSFSLDRVAIRDLLNIGGPKGVQMIVSNATDLVQRVFLIAAGGTNAVMYYNYSWRYIELVNLPARAYENAMVPVCSAGYGQGDLEKMKAGFSYASKMAMIYSVVLAMWVFFFAEPLIEILTYEESMVALRSNFVWTLQMAVLLIPFAAMMGIGSSMLQVLKKARLSMNFYFAWGFVKLLMYAVSAYVFDSFEGIIYSMVVVHIIGGVLLLWMGHREFHKVCIECQKEI